MAMTEYKVVVTLTEIYTGYVEAESEEQAEKLALAALEAGDLEITVDSMDVEVEDA